MLYLGSINQPGDYIIMTELLAGNVCQVLKKTKDTGHSISWIQAEQVLAVKQAVSKSKKTNALSRCSWQSLKRLVTLFGCVWMVWLQRTH